MLRPLAVGGLVVVGIVVVGFVLIRLLENSLVFFPARYSPGEWTPRRLGVNAEELSFRTADGLTLHGWWFEANPRVPSTDTGAVAGAAGEGAPSGRSGADGSFAPVLLWAHGNGGNLVGRAPHAQVLADEGLSVFVFDYRGYGRSEGNPNEAGIYVDMEAAYEFLVQERGIAAERIILLGRSLGSAPAARLSTMVPHAGVVLVSPLPSARRMARRMFGGLPIDVFATADFPVVDWVAQRSTPLLIFHGDRDEVIPLAYGREVFEAAADPKELVMLAGAGHNDVLAAGGRRYLDPLVEFARAAVRSARFTTR